MWLTGSSAQGPKVAHFCIGANTLTAFTGPRSRAPCSYSTSLLGQSRGRKVVQEAPKLKLRYFGTTLIPMSAPLFWTFNHEGIFSLV